MALPPEHDVQDLAEPVVRARRLADEVHDGQHDRYGLPMLAHVDRVAAAVPAEARTVALVHDVAERSAHDPGDVAALVGLDDDELGALVLLTKHEGESLIDHVRRVVGADPGAARELAVAVKVADVGDHVARDRGTGRDYDAALRLLGAVGAV
jgi:hypothetical protein